MAKTVGFHAPKGRYTVTMHMEELATALTDMLSEIGGDPTKLDALVRRRLGEYGFDPDACYSLGMTIVHMAIQAGEAPEDTIQASFVMGLVLGAQLGVKP